MSLPDMAKAVVAPLSIALVLLVPSCNSLSRPLEIEREQPRYKVVREADDYELREYKPGGSFSFSHH